MSARHASRRRVNARRSSTLAKLCRAIEFARPLLEPLENRRLLAYAYFDVPGGGDFGSGVGVEGGAPVRVAVYRSDANADFDTVSFSLTGTGDHPVSSSDWQIVPDDPSTVDLQSNSFHFSTGQTVIYFDLVATQDDLMEADENFEFTLLDHVEENPDPASFVGTLKSDDDEIWIEGGGMMNEGGQVQFTLHREDISGASANAAYVRLRLKTSGDGAHQASLDDYALADSVTGDSYEDPATHLFDLYFNPYQSTRTITVTATDDALGEPDEYLKVVLLYANLMPPYSDYGPVPLSQTLPTQAFAGIAENDGYTDTPAAPTNLTATPFSETAVQLNWQDNSNNESGFLVEKSFDAGANWSTVNIVAPDSTSTTVENLDPGHSYQFRLTAQNTNGQTQSDPTPAAKSNTLPDSDSAQEWLEAINVPIDGSTTTTSTILQANVEYQIQVKRSNIIDTTQTDDAPFGTAADAEYAWPNDTTTQPTDSFQGTDVGLQLDGAQESNISWGQLATDPDHTYTINITGNGQPLRFHYRLPTSATPQEGDYLNIEISRITPIVTIETIIGNTVEASSEPAVLKVARTGSTNRDLVVQLEPPEGSATQGLDYDDLPSSVTIPSGARSQTLSVMPKDDSEAEDFETIDLAIAPDASYSCIGAPARVILNDNVSVSSIEVSRDMNFAANHNAQGFNFAVKVIVHGERVDQLAIRQLINSETGWKHWNGQWMTNQEILNLMPAGTDPAVINSGADYRVDTGWDWQGLDAQPETNRGATVSKTDGQLHNVDNQPIVINDIQYNQVRRAYLRRWFKIEVRQVGTDAILKEHDWGFYYNNDNANWTAQSNPPAPAPSCAGLHLGAGEIIDMFGVDGFDVAW